MKRLLRPSLLILLPILLLAGAAVWVYRSTTLPDRPVPPAVEGADREIAFLMPATSAGTWQRFVQAACEVAGVEPGKSTYPKDSAAVPELAVSLPGRKARLLFRWYKLTNDWKADYWVKALLERRPPPLAILGGSTTAAAAELAGILKTEADRLAPEHRPLLLLTTATADTVLPRDGDGASVVGDGVPLVDIYNERTFRFCFTNRQMAVAVTGFIWSEPELRPDTFPVYTVAWQDDAYSSDLIKGFADALDRRKTRMMMAATLSDRGLVAGSLAAAAGPFHGLMFENAALRDAPIFLPNYVSWSVGGFDRPNRDEVKVATEVLDERDKQPRQQRPLLVLAGQSQPSRRFVRALERLSPRQARDFVLASGDAISFNVVCRDRETTWPIQDLPCSLVFFCHHNPIDDPRFSEGDTSVSGTEDLLLYKDICMALLEADGATEGPCRNAGGLRDRLLELGVSGGRPARTTEGPRMFDKEGNRQSGSGEHVVWLQPRFQGERVLPEATIRVSAWDTGRRVWVPRGEPLSVRYVGARGER